MVCAIEESKELDSMTVEQLEGSLLAYEEKMKRRKEEQLLKLIHPSKDLKVTKVTKEMDNGEALEVLEEEEVVPIISTMKIKVTSHSEVVVMVNEEAKYVDPINVQMK